MSDFDQEDIISSSTSDFDDADIVKPIETEAVESPDMGRLEAAVTSFGQGSGLGTAPIVSGIVGAGANAIGQIGDALGLTTDAQLEKQGFTMPDKKTGLEGLMEAYYDSRDRQKGAQQEAHDNYPVQSIAMNIAGSIPTTIASGGATGAASKILPRADVFNKATGVGTKILAGAREGAKAGALVGLGEGDAKLAEGEIGDTLKEVAGSTIGGAAIGGLIPAAVGAVKGVGKVVTDLPISKQIATAYKGGKAGIKLDEDSAGNAIKTYSEDLLNKIQQQFREAGLSKANAMDYADEIGARVNAGETFQEVMDDMIKRGASSTADLAEKKALLRTFDELRNGPRQLGQEALDVNRAKNIQKMGEKGFDLADEDIIADSVDSLVSGTRSPKTITAANQTFNKMTPKGTQEVTKIIQQASEELPIKINQYDLDNLSLRQVEDIIGEINRHTGDLTGPASTNAEKVARQLAGQLRTLSEEALEDIGQTSGNKSLSRTFSAVGRAGIDDNILTQNPVRKDAMVDKLRNTVTAGNPINRERMFQYLEEASDGYKGQKEAASFLNNFNDLAKNVKPLNSTNAMGLLGSAKNIGLTAANKAGGMTKSLRELTEAAPQKLEQIAQRMGMSPSKDAQQYATVLMKALQGDQKQRSATLFGLYQQPAFRELYQNLGEDIVDEITPVGTDESSN